MNCTTSYGEVGELVTRSERRGRSFGLVTASRTALRATQLPIQWVPDIIFQGTKQSELEVDHSLCIYMRNLDRPDRKRL